MLTSDTAIRSLIWLHNKAVRFALYLDDWLELLGIHDQTDV